MRGSFKTLVLGVTLATMSASGIFSLTNDVIDIGPNDFSSGQYGSGGGGPAHDVAIATVSAEEPACPTDAAPGEFYEADDQIPGVINGESLDINPGEDRGIVVQQDDICVKNFGTEPVALTLAAITFDSREIQPCSVQPGQDSTCSSEAPPVCPSSEQAAGDTSCTAGAEGEFVPEDITFKTVNVTETSTCSTTAFKAFDGPSTLTTYLEPGQVCRFFIYAESNPDFTEQQRQVRQTDTVEFMLQMVASDGFLL